MYDGDTDLKVVVKEVWVTQNILFCLFVAPSLPLILTTQSPIFFRKYPIGTQEPIFALILSPSVCRTLPYLSMDFSGSFPPSIPISFLPSATSLRYSYIPLQLSSSRIYNACYCYFSYFLFSLQFFLFAWVFHCGVGVKKMSSTGQFFFSSF